MSSKSSCDFGDFTTGKILAWARSLETFERLDFVYLLMHSLFPTELRYIHGIIDGLLKRDEAIFSSGDQANDFVRLSHFYEGHDPQMVIANDSLRRQFIVDLSALHPLNFYCADIFFGVLQRAELSTWTFSRENLRLLRELILITTMVSRHAAFRFDNRLYIWNVSRILIHKLRSLKESDDEETVEEPVDVDYHSDLDSIESQATLTTSGCVVRADREINQPTSGGPRSASGGPRSASGGPRSAPPLLPQPAHEAEKRPSASLLSNPPFSFPISNWQPQQANSSPNSLRNHTENPPKPKTVSVPARTNENVPVVNNSIRKPPMEVSFPIEPQQNHIEQRPILPPRANSVEYCDRHQYEQKNFYKKGEPRFNSQRSVPLHVEKSSMEKNIPLRPVEPVLYPEGPLIKHNTANLQSLSANLQNSISANLQSLPANFQDNITANLQNLSANLREPETFQKLAPVDVAEQVLPVVRPPLLPNAAGGIKGSFPRVYAIAGPNYPAGAPLMTPHIVQQIPLPVANVQLNSVEKVVSCYNCGLAGHYGDVCPKKKPMESDRADKFCPNRRDMRLYQDKDRQTFRQPGSHS